MVSAAGDGFRGTVGGVDVPAVVVFRNSEAWVSKSYDSVVVRRFWVLVGFGAIAGNPIRIWSLVQSLVLLVSG
jgi:hypothetical protein